MKGLYWFVRGSVRIFFTLFYRLKVYGLENLQRDQGFIIAANHASFYDPPIIAASFPYEVHFLARESLFRNAIFSRLIASLNAHPLSGEAGDAKIFRAVGKLLSEGKKVILFPEGTRSKDGNIGPIKPGIGLLTMKNQAMIIPTYVYGSYEVFNRHRVFPKITGRIACIFGAPISWEGFSNMDRKQAQVAIAASLERKLQELKEWYERGAKGPIP